MLRGTSAVVVSGQDGYEVQTYRKIRDKKGKVISKKKEAYSLYKSTDTVIAEGTAKPKPKPKPKQKENAKPETNQGQTSAP
jgi:cobyric acid synthase